jgi:hypothetical protein
LRPFDVPQVIFEPYNQRRWLRASSLTPSCSAVGLVFAAHTPLDPRSLADQEAGATAVKRSSRADRSFQPRGVGVCETRILRLLSKGDGGEPSG